MQATFLRALLLASTAVGAGAGISGPAYAQERQINVETMDLAKALAEIERQSGRTITFDPDAVPGKTSMPVRNARDAIAAVRQAIAGSGLSADVNSAGVITVGNDIIVIATRDEAETSFRVDGAQSSNRSGKSLKELPQGTEVITSALFDLQQAQNINDALRNSAGVTNTIGNVQGTPTFSVRGQTATGLQNGIVSGANSTAIDTVERIEILKGPSAILAGANSLGGLVNIVDKRPVAEPLLDVSLQYGTFDEKKFVVDASNALDEEQTLSARIIGVLARTESSYGDYQGRREEVIAPSLRYKTSSTDLIAGLNVSQTRSALGNFRILDPETSYESFLDVPGRIGPREQGFDNSVLRVNLSGEHRFNSWFTLAARGNYTKDTLKAAIYAPLGFFDPGSPNTLFAFAQSINNRQSNYSGDIYARLTFKTGPMRHTVTAGYNYSRLGFRSFSQDPSIDPLVLLDVTADNTQLPIPAASTFLSYDLTAIEDGFYVQDFIDFGKLHVLAGIRINKYRSTIVFPDSSGNTEKAKASTPSIGAVFDVTKTVSIYANYQEGFSPVNALDCDGNRLPNQTTTNIEGGVKADFFSNRLSATLSAYQLKQNNLTIPDFTCPIFDRSTSQGGQRTRGVEFTLGGEVVKGFNISASYSFADNEYQNPSIDFGLVPPLLYRHKYSLYGHYEFQDGALKGLGIGAGVFGNGRTYVDTLGEISLAPQAQIDGNLTYRIGRARFNLGVKNLTDKKLYAPASNPSYIPYLAPRTVTATLTFNFFN